MKNVLLIDVNKKFRNALARHLMICGYNVIEATCGQEGMHLYCAHPADAVIVELFLPEKDGLEVIRELKMISPATPIIALAEQNSFASLLSIASKLGATETVAKDRSNFEIMHRIETLLGEQLSAFQEKRQHPRRDVLIPGLIFSETGEVAPDTLPCTVLNLSLSGAMLRINMEALALQQNTSDLSDFFLEMLMDGNQEVFHCNLRREQTADANLVLGVQFADLTRNKLIHLKHILG